MKNLIKTAACFLLLMGGGAINAEENGVFVGVSYQGGQTYLNEDAKIEARVDVMNLTIGSKDFSAKKDRMLNGAGLKIGYKQFFGASKTFGLRYYAFLDYGFSNFGALIPEVKDKKVNTSNLQDYKTHMLSYGVGVDALYNFIDKENTSFGLFLGVGLGADTWIANGEEFQKLVFPNGKATYANFQTTIDVGLRTNLYKHHGFELGVKVPLLQDRIFADDQDNIFNGTGTIPGAPVGAPKVPFSAYAKNTTDVHRLYSVYISYLYTF